MYITGIKIREECNKCFVVSKRKDVLSHNMKVESKFYVDKKIGIS